jgi:iron(III) transport system permease protein
MKVKTRKRASRAERGFSERAGRGRALSDSGDEFLPRARGRFAWVGSGGATFLLLATGFFVLYPLALLVYGSFVVSRGDGRAGFGFEAWLSAWNQAGMVQSLVNTATRTVATEIISLPLAVLIAWLVARSDLPGKRLIDNLMWVAFFLPALPVLLGWILLFGPDYGIVNQVLMKGLGFTQPVFDIYSFSGIVFAHLASRSISAKYIFLVPAFRNIDSSLEEAGRIAGSGTLATIGKILVPLLLPAILITAAISLIHSLESFEIELILGPPVNFYVFSTKMYQLMRQSPPLFSEATVLGFAILIVVLPLILWQQRLLAANRFVAMTGKSQQRPFRLGRWRWPALMLLALLGMFTTLVPGICLILGTFMNIFGRFDLATVWTADHWSEVLSDPLLLRALSNTLTMAGAAAIVGVSWFTLVAYISVRTRYPGRKLLDFVTWLPASLPGVILSLGLLWMFLTVPFFRPLYGTIFVLVVAVLINAVTTSTQIIKSNMVQIGSELEEAAYVAGAGRAATYRAIVLPLLAPVLVAAALYIFSTAARNVATIVMIATGGNRPLALLQIDYMIDGQYEAASIVGVFIVALTCGVAMAARGVGRHFGFRTL